MARVMLTSVSEGRCPDDHEDLVPLMRMRRCATTDRFGVHEIVTRADDADIVLFVEYRGPGLYQAGLRRHPLVREDGARCFCFCSIDQVVPFMPGIYASLPEHRYDPSRHRSGHYVRGLFRPAPPYAGPLDGDARWLASFRGSLATHRVRRELARVAAGPRILVEDSEAKRRWGANGNLYMGYTGDVVSDYFGLIDASAFALCPRGYGASSMRLFEAMSRGRAPVIVGDAWVAPEGPDWGAFSVRVAERDVARLPSILAEREPEARAMGIRAREAWEAWFSEEASFHRVVGWCEELAAARRATEPARRWLAYGRLVDEDVLAMRLRSYRGRLRRLARKVRKALR
ncbi:MAG: exostosin family protein [Deltaproteobacteria bacterium]|nr:exostosin family protein [Deltaproteobacteria bacterium]